MARKNSIKELERQAAETKARHRDNLLQRDALTQEYRALCAEERREDTPAIRLVEIPRRKGQIEREIARLRNEESRLGADANQAEIALSTAQRRLTEARRVLDKIENPPPWGLGDYSPHEIGKMKRQAEKTIKELA